MTRMPIVAEMSDTYSVDVERHGRPWASLIVRADTPMLACELAERIVCQAADGNLDKLADYFAAAVRNWVSQPIRPYRQPR